MLETINARAASAGDVFVNASRQLWLASLGAAVVAREWAEKEAGSVFRSLVREGTAVESRAFRFVGDRLDTSFNQANTLWKRARHTVTAYADTTATLVRDSLPASLPKIEAKATAKKPAKRVAKRTRKSATRRASTKRTSRTKTANKRA